MQILYTHMNIFDIPITKDGSEAVCVTTNGVVKSNGEAVCLKSNGNHVYTLCPAYEKNSWFTLISFPTKNDWRDDSDINLIRQSAQELMLVLDNHGIKRCYLTPPGCANGHLNWECDVKPVIAPILDDRVIIVIRS